MSKANAIEQKTLVNDKIDSLTAEDRARAVRALIDDQQLHSARQAAAEAARDHPDHPWLAQANRVLNPSRTVKRPATGRGRSREFAWLRQNAAAHRGHWIALLGDHLIASAERFQEVQRAVQENDLDDTPLLHYIA